MTYGGGPFIQIGQIILSDNTIGPLNIPYSRVSDTLQLIMENKLTSEFTPFEWWLDYSGRLCIDQKRGTDKSSTVHLVAGDQIAGSRKEQITKQTSQRVRVTGRGESADQDRNTSDWHENLAELDNVNSFYEKIESDKSLSSKEEVDIWAQVLLAQNSPIRNEITIVLENDWYTANDFDLGDEVTVTDPATGLSGTYRVKTIEKWIIDGGEKVIVTVSKRRTDVMDRLSNLFKIFERMKNSSTYLDVLYAEGGKQRKIDPSKVEDVWEQTSSNEWAIELPEEALADDYIEECDRTGTITISSDKDEFSLTCNANSEGITFLTEPLLKFSRDPRFTCEFEIDTDVGDAWATDDLCLIRIWQEDIAGGWCTTPWGLGGFGFQILKTATDYELKAYIHNGLNTTNVKIANLAVDTKYIIEARMEWREKVIKYYFGKADVDKDDPQWGFRLRAILPVLIDGTTEDVDNLCPFHLLIDSRHGAQTQTLILVIFRWRTQAIRAVEG